MISFRPSGFDELGLRRALSDRMLPLLVAAMAFLAALAMAGWFGTAALSRHWRQGAGASLTVQVPRPAAAAAQGTQTRLAAVLALLSGTPGVASVHALSDSELADLLKPWLGQGAERLAIPVPAVIAVRLTDATAAADSDLANNASAGARADDGTEALSRRLTSVAPDTMVEDHGVWIGRLAILARSLQACAGFALVLVAGVAAAVIAVATRAGLSTRREAIEIVHGLGATDGFIAARFAGRATILATAGAACGAMAALPVLLALVRLAAPFAGDAGAAGDTLPAVLGALPAALWVALLGLPAGAAAIGFVTAQTAVRRWLRRLP